MHPISKILCNTYEELYRRGQVKFPLYDVQRDNIDSVVKTVNATYFGFNRFPTSEDKAVAYLCYLIKDHPVTDGNKRLSLLWFEVYCEVQDLRPMEPPTGWDVLAVSIEKSTTDMEDTMSIVKSIVFPKERGS